MVDLGIDPAEDLDEIVVSGYGSGAVARISALEAMDPMSQSGESLKVALGHPKIDMGIGSRVRASFRKPGHVLEAAHRPIALMPI